MIRRIIIDADGFAYADGEMHDDTGILLQADMAWDDNMPARETPVPDRSAGWRLER